MKIENRNRDTLLIAVLGAAALLFMLLATDEFARRTGSQRGVSEWILAPTGFLIAVAAFAAWRTFRRTWWISLPLLASAAGVVVQVALIGFKISSAGGDGPVAVYIANAMIVHALVLTTTVIAFRTRIDSSPRLAYETPFARLTLLVVLFVFLSLVSGSFLTIAGAPAVCRSWPLCGPDLIPKNGLEWIALMHRLTVGVSGALMLTVLILGWRTQRYRSSTMVMLTVAALLFLAQILIGAVMALREPDVAMIALHVATGPAVWAAVIVLAVNVGLARPTTEGEGLSAFHSRRPGERVRDFLALTKPIIVLLLLATTLAGMVVGLGAWPPAATIFWTLLGGALAAGGSGAINQFIDRDVDALMKRTAARPLAAGRLTPAEGLAFGVGLCLSAFYLLAVFVNLLAAALAVVGMFYYVWLYSIVLKKATVQNIVIGGGAGSIPPLVGWAAATGSLTVPSLLLFAIVFFWTPPHFWALALLRSRDYARGGIPMLPVVRGEAETCRQILVYTVLLVGITLLAPVVGLAGMVYFAGALILGAGLISIAWRLWRGYTPKLAWRMYRWSSMYLFFLFAVMMVDVLI
ncbi:MAG TPA: heme o synthase [Anaerolineales bacterium]|nr:heme o synthase [Anaerolineales bacterium]